MPQGPQDRASIQDAPTVLVFYYFLAWSLIFEPAYPTTGTTDQMRTSAKPITVVLQKTVAIKPKATSAIGKYFLIRSTMPCAIFAITLTNRRHNKVLKWGHRQSPLGGPNGNDRLCGLWLSRSQTIPLYELFGDCFVQRSMVKRHGFGPSVPKPPENKFRLHGLAKRAE